MIDFYEVFGRILCDPSVASSFHSLIGLPSDFDLIGDPSNAVVAFPEELYDRIRSAVKAKGYLSLSPFLSLFSAGELLYGFGEPEWRTLIETVSASIVPWFSSLSPAAKGEGMLYVGLAAITVDSNLRGTVVTASVSPSLSGIIAPGTSKYLEDLAKNYATYTKAATALCGANSGWRPPCFVKYNYYSGHVHPMG